MGKDDRFQTRMDAGLKAWFYSYALGKGGMSRVFHKLVEDLYFKVTGSQWRDGDGRSTENSEADTRLGKG